MSYSLSDAELVEIRRARDRPAGQPHGGDHRVCRALCEREMLALAQDEAAEGGPGPVYELTPTGHAALDWATSENR